ncbi:MAG: chitobiase/beta-hexosaminidase C-terminal domain-containing protein, partial [Bacteroidaceae bacterium]|nr:chitobiase/beta-hexosaminidase C-terminal domain-containing protein [Bacteroidaceae bacterium]
AESGATIYYTTDGSTPTSASTQYSSAITLSNTTTVKAVAVKNGVTSTVASQTFTKSDNGGGGNGDAD